MDYREAKHLLEKYFEGDISLKEEELLRDYYASNPVVPEDMAYAKAFFTAVKQERIVKSSKSVQNYSKTKWLLVGSVAASILLFIGIFVFEPMQNQSIVYKQNNKSQPKKVNLPYGVTVWLNADAKVSFSKISNTDELPIFLEGEAFVESSGERALKVVSNDMSVVSEGQSAFNIDATIEKEHVTITVQTGLVNVSESNHKQGMALLIAADNYCSINKKHKLMFTANNTNENYLSWKTGELVFNNQPMANVAEVLQNYYGVELLIENQKLAYCEYSGQFKNKSLRQVLQGIQSDLPFEYREEFGGIMLLGESCN